MCIPHSKTTENNVHQTQQNMTQTKIKQQQKMFENVALRFNKYRKCLQTGSECSNTGFLIGFQTVCVSHGPAPFRISSRSRFQQPAMTGLKTNDTTKYQHKDTHLLLVQLKEFHRYVIYTTL